MTVKAVRGEDFLGFEHGGKEIKACYVDGELSEVDQGQRLQMFGVIGDESLKGRFDYLSLSDQKLDPKKLIERTQEKGYNMVVLDSIRTLFGVDDENEASSWHELGLLVKTLRDRGVFVVVIHHTNKDKNTVVYAGSSNIETTFSGLVGLKENGARGGLKLDVKKSRSGSFRDAWDGLEIRLQGVDSLCHRFPGKGGTRNPRDGRQRQW